MKTLISLVLGLLIAGCASTPNTAVNAPVSEVERDYILRDRNPDVVPDWVKDFSKFKREGEGKGLTFYRGESGDVSDKIAGCDIASLEGKKRISERVAALITDKIAASKAGMLLINKDDPNNPGMRRHFQDTVAGKSMAFLSGIQEFGQYWEERDYSKTGGNKRVYSCTVVLSIDDKSLEAALKNTAKKTPEVVEDAQAKKDVTDALKDVDSAFRSYSSVK